MSEVQLIITIENDEQADRMLAVLNEGEVNGELDFTFNVERMEEYGFKRDGKFVHLDDVGPAMSVEAKDAFTKMSAYKPTFSVGDDGEPMI